MTRDPLTQDNEAKRLVLIAYNVQEQALLDLRSEFSQVYEFRKTSSKEEDLALAGEAEVLAMFRPSAEIVSRAKKCKWVQTFTAGVENFLEIDAIRKNEELLLTNMSGIHGVPISEYIFVLVLALTRRLKTTVLNQQKKEWIGSEDYEKRPRYAFELDGKTMLVVGLGSIGLLVAKKAKAFGMHTLAIKRDPTKPPKDPEYSEYVDQLYGTKDLEKAVSCADVVVDVLPLTTETTKIFDATIFSKMKRGAIFVNVGRGKTVVEKDLIAALNSGKISAAGLDVFEEEPLPKDSTLWEMDNVIVSPHISGWRESYFEEGLKIFKENLRRYSSGKPLLNLVDKRAGY